VANPGYRQFAKDALQAGQTSHLGRERFLVPLPPMTIGKAGAFVGLEDLANGLPLGIGVDRKTQAAARLVRTPCVQFLPCIFFFSGFKLSPGALACDPGALVPVAGGGVTVESSPEGSEGWSGITSFPV
jgi:hypothetical protein